MTKNYDRRAFAVAYLEAQPDYSHPFIDDESEYNALFAHRGQLLKGLESLFGLELTDAGVSDRTDGSVLFMLFRSTARSHLEIKSSGFLEGGLLIKVLERSGQGEPVFKSMERSIDLRARTRESHVDTMELLLGILLGDRADAVFTSADLREIGVDDTEPRAS